MSNRYPEVNGTYPLDERTQLRMMTIAQHIAYHHQFPCGVSAYPRLDISGKVRLFPATGVFEEWVTAVFEYIAALEIVIETGEGEFPAQPVKLG